jgi:plasmid stabilization system protein ParE
MSIIVLRPLARIDLADIWDYIAEDSEDSADVFINKLERKFLTIAA